jgi:hypothetical protein
MYVPVERFDRLLASHRCEDGRPVFLSEETIQGLLNQKQSGTFRTMLKTFAIDPDDWQFKLRPPAPPLKTSWWWEPQDPLTTHPIGWVRADEGPVANDLLLKRLFVRERDEKDYLKISLKELREPDPDKPQPRYQVQVWLEVEDTFTEGDNYRRADLNPRGLKGGDEEWKLVGTPKGHLTQSKERFTFVVVSELELLAKIGEEQEAKRRELKKSFEGVLDAQKGLALEALIAQLKDGALTKDEAASKAVRAGNTDADVLAQAQKDARNVLSAYQRILREMQLNQVDNKMLRRVFFDVVAPMGGRGRFTGPEGYEEDKNRTPPPGICEEPGGNFESARLAVQDLQKVLADDSTPLKQRVPLLLTRAEKADAEMKELVRRMAEVLDRMEGLVEIADLIRLLVQIEESTKRIDQELRDRYRKAVEKLLK